MCSTIWRILFVVALIAVVRGSNDVPPLPYAAVSSSDSQTGFFGGGDRFETSNGFNIQSGYEGYLIPASEHGVLSFADGLDLKSHHGFLLRLLKTFVSFAAKIVPKVALGAVVLLTLFLVGGCVNAVVCTFTPFCTISFAGFGVTKDAMRSYLSPDRISTTATFVMDAIKKYQDLYESSEKDIETGKKS